MPFFRWFRSKPKEEDVAEGHDSATSLNKLLSADSFRPPVDEVSKASEPVRPDAVRAERPTENSEPNEASSVVMPCRVGEIAELPPDIQDHSAAASPSNVAETLGVAPDSRDDSALPEASDFDQRTVTLPLGPLLSQLRSDQLKNSIQTEATITVPLFLIRPQLTSGKIVLSLKDFAPQLSPELNLGELDLSETIQLPLREILGQLPPEIIKLRDDQEVETLTDLVETPFTLQAQEDAAALDENPTPSLESDGTKNSSEPLKGIEPARSSLQAHTIFSSDLLRTIFMTEEELDLNKVVDKIAHLPGLNGASLNNLRGENLAGTFQDLNDPMFSAFARISRHARDLLAETSLPRLNALTFFAGAQQFSTFVLDPFTLTVSHDRRPFRPGVREQIQMILPELVRLNER